MPGLSPILYEIDMAQRVTIPWTTGTGNIYLDFDEARGNQVVAVSSDANPLLTQRTQILTFTAVGATPVQLTVKQSPRRGDFDNSFDMSFTINY